MEAGSSFRGYRGIQGKKMVTGFDRVMSIRSADGLNAGDEKRESQDNSILLA
jgi:hypothetical protein